MLLFFGAFYCRGAQQETGSAAPAPGCCGGGLWPGGALLSPAGRHGGEQPTRVPLYGSPGGAAQPGPALPRRQCGVLTANVQPSRGVKSPVESLCKPEKELLEFRRLYLPHRRDKGAVSVAGLEGVHATSHACSLNWFLNVFLTCSEEAPLKSGWEKSTRAVVHESAVTVVAELLHRLPSHTFFYGVKLCCSVWHLLVNLHE